MVSRIENRMNNKFGFRFFVSLSILLSGLAGPIGCFVVSDYTTNYTLFFCKSISCLIAGKAGSGRNNFITRINKLFSKLEFIFGEVKIKAKENGTLCDHPRDPKADLFSKFEWKGITNPIPGLCTLFSFFLSFFLFQICPPRANPWIHFDDNRRILWVWSETQTESEVYRFHIIFVMARFDSYVVLCKFNCSELNVRFVFEVYLHLTFISLITPIIINM